MHLALENEDILHEIFSRLSMRPANREGPRARQTFGTYRPWSLLQAALTCRTFKEPALDSLWWQIDSVVDLLTLIPAFDRDLENYDDDSWVRYGLLNHPNLHGNTDT